MPPTIPPSSALELWEAEALVLLLVAEELTGVTGEESDGVASEFGVDTGATVAAGLLVAAAVVWVAFAGFLTFFTVCRDVLRLAALDFGASARRWTFASFCELIPSKLRTGVRAKGD